MYGRRSLRGAQGKIGGLALWWTNNVSVQVLMKRPYIIDTLVTINHVDNPIHMTWVHADTDENVRCRNWEELRQVGIVCIRMWVCQGDFNAITHHYEKEGGRMKSQRQIDEFNQLIHDIGMEDLGSKGQRFTWCNNCRGQTVSMKY